MTVYEFISFLVALTALVLAIYEGVTNRQFHKLSIQPILKITYHFGGTFGKYGISVSNKGLGPAIIKQCIIKIGNETFNDNEDSGWNRFIEKRNLTGMDPDIILNKIAPDGVIIHEEKIWLMHVPLITDKDKDKANREKLEKAFKNFYLEIRYTSMFGDAFETSIEI